MTSITSAFEMYRKACYSLHKIIIDVPQDAEPIQEQPKKNKRDAIIKEVQYSSEMSGKETNDIDFLNGYNPTQKKRNT